MFYNNRKHYTNSIIDRNRKIQEIYKDEMNNECFDCGKSNPDFISANNGVFICKDCMAIHYQFSDEVISRDAVTSLIFGVTGLICIIFVVVMGIVLKGEVPFEMGALLLAAGIMAITGVIFGFLSYRDSDGGILSKRWSVIISIIDIALLVVLYLI